MSSQFSAGFVLDDRYEIQSVVGHGAAGIVYRALDLTMHRTVAVKVIAAADESATKRFLQETRALSSLDHPNIVSAFSAGKVPGGEAFLVMEYLEGQTLQSRLTEGPLATAEIQSVFSQICAGLSKAHLQGLIHCDLKPGNIIITNEGVVKILDFGIARLVVSPGQDLTQTGLTRGTPLYMSPQRCQGLNVGASDDIYSLGCMIFECAYGTPPFSGETALGVVLNHVNEKPVFPHEHDLKPVMAKCLAKTPQARFQDVQQVSYSLANPDTKRYRTIGDITSSISWTGLVHGLRPVLLTIILCTSLYYALTISTGPAILITRMAYPDESQALKYANFFSSIGNLEAAKIIYSTIDPPPVDLALMYARHLHANTANLANCLLSINATVSYRRHSGIFTPAEVADLMKVIEILSKTQMRRSQTMMLQLAIDQCVETHCRWPESVRIQLIKNLSRCYSHGQHELLINNSLFNLSKTLGDIYYKRGEYFSAIRYYQQCRENSGTDFTKAVSAWFMLRTQLRLHEADGVRLSLEALNGLVNTRVNVSTLDSLCSLSEFLIGDWSPDSPRSTMTASTLTDLVRWYTVEVSTGKSGFDAACSLSCLEYLLGQKQHSRMLLQVLATQFAKTTQTGAGLANVVQMAEKLRSEGKLDDANIFQQFAEQAAHYAIAGPLNTDQQIYGARWKANYLFSHGHFHATRYLCEPLWIAVGLFNDDSNMIDIASILLALDALGFKSPAATALKTSYGKTPLMHPYTSDRWLNSTKVLRATIASRGTPAKAEAYKTNMLALLKKWNEASAAWWNLGEQTIER